MRTSLKCATFSFFVISIFLVSGCSGEKMVPVRGTLILPDDVTVTDGDMVNVAFTPTNDSQKLGVGHAKGPDRSFEVMTGTSKGLAPGEYKISISLTPDVGKDKATKKMDEMGFFVQDFNMKCNRPASVLLFKVENDSGQSIKIDLQAGAISVSK